MNLKHFSKMRRVSKNDLQEFLNKKPNSKASVYKPALLPIKENKVLLVESKREPGTYKTVGGRIESDESILDCINREMEEELRPESFEVMSHLYNSGIQSAIDEPDLTVELDFFLIELGNFSFDYSENRDFIWANIDDVIAQKYKVSESLITALSHL